MAHPELKELRRQLKELLDAGYIRPSTPYDAPVSFHLFDYASTVRRSTRLPSRISILSLASMTCSIDLEMQGTLASSI